VKGVARQCLAAYIQIDGQRAYALFDSGSSADIIAPDFARVMKLASFKLESAVPIQLGCVGSRSAIHHGVKVDLSIGDRRVNGVYFDIANVDRYDAIVGTKLMYDMNIVLDVRDRTIFVGGLEGRAVKAILPEEEQTLLEATQSRRRTGAKASTSRLKEKGPGE
jgi:hypothetical protein